MSNQHTFPFRRPPIRYRRRGAVRIVLPGVGEQAKRMDGRNVPDLTPILTEPVDEHHNIRELEVLSYSGSEQQEHIIAPKLYAASSEDTTLQSGLHQFDDLAVSPERSSAVDSLAEAAMRHLPEKIGVEAVDVDLSPLGVTPMRTGRVILEANNEPVGDNVAYKPMDWLIRQLVAAAQPHLIQLLLRKESERKYSLSVRIVVFDAAAMSPLQTTFADMITDGVKYDPAELLEDLGLTSNFQIPIKDYYSKYYGRYTPSPAKYKERSDSLQARELYEGCVEYEELLRGRLGSNPLYKDLIGYPRMPVNNIQLRQFADLSPRYYDNSLWSDVSGRNPPTLVTKEVLRSAPGTEHGLGTKTEPISETYYEESANSGTENHEYRLQHVVRYYRQQGIEAERVEQDTSSVPDGRAYTDAGVRALESTNKTLSKPAKPIVNAVRASENNQPVTFVTKNQDQASDLYGLLKKPYRDAVGDGVILYTLTGGVTLTDGATVLLPAHADEAEWVLTTDGRLKLSTQSGDRIIAEGDAETAVGQYEYDAPRYVVDGETHKVLSANDELIESGHSKDAVLDEWTKLQPPFVPTGLHYLDVAEIKYQAGDALEDYDPVPKWLGVANGKRETYAGAMAEFLRLYTQDVRDAELRKSTFNQTFDDWYRARIDDDGGSSDGDFRVPKHEIGRARPKRIDTKRREIDGSFQELMKDLTFVYPVGLQSPDLPVFEEDDGHSEE